MRSDVPVIFNARVDIVTNRKEYVSQEKMRRIALQHQWTADSIKIAHQEYIPYCGTHPLSTDALGSPAPVMTNACQVFAILPQRPASLSQSLWPSVITRIDCATRPKMASNRLIRQWIGVMTHGAHATQNAKVATATTRHGGARRSRRRRGSAMRHQMLAIRPRWTGASKLSANATISVTLGNAIIISVNLDHIAIHCVKIPKPTVNMMLWMTKLLLLITLTDVKARDASATSNAFPKIVRNIKF